MTWAEMGFSAEPLTPTGDVIRHLRRALAERLHYAGRDWNPLDPLHTTDATLKPLHAEVNEILALLRPDNYLDGRGFWYYSMPLLYQIGTTDAPAASNAWCNATQEEYYARMNAIAGFDISQDISPLTPPTTELFRGLQRAINSIHFTFDEAYWTSHYRQWETYWSDPADGGDGLWHDSYGDWEELRDDFQYMGHLMLGQSCAVEADYGDGYDYWMLSGDGVEWARPTKDVVCKAFCLRCDDNSVATISQLEGYEKGEYYVREAPATGRLNILNGYNPPAIPHYDKSSYEFCVFWPAYAIIDYGAKLKYYDPPPEN